MFEKLVGLYLSDAAGGGNSPGAAAHAMNIILEAHEKEPSSFDAYNPAKMLLEAKSKLDVNKACLVKKIIGNTRGEQIDDVSFGQQLLDLAADKNNPLMDMRRAALQGWDEHVKLLEYYPLLGVGPVFGEIIKERGTQIAKDASDIWERIRVRIIGPQLPALKSLACK